MAGGVTAVRTGPGQKHGFIPPHGLLYAWPTVPHALQKVTSKPQDAGRPFSALGRVVQEENLAGEVPLYGVSHGVSHTGATGT